MDRHSAHNARHAIPVPDAGHAPHAPHEATSEQEHPAHLEGRILGGCRLVRLLSAGGMGEVYLGEQVRLGNRLVAVKVVRPEEAVAPVGNAIPNLEARFMREGKLLGRFSHPNILPVHDSGIDDGYLYLVMQYTPDGSLADAICGTAPYRLNLPARLALSVDIIEQIASALQYTHDQGVVHRDVKPANVLIQREPDGCRRMLLADFGIARDMESTTQWNQITGTVTYMAPEQFSGRFSPASDQYALAVVAYLLLAGRPPFTGSVAQVTRAHLSEVPFAVRTFNAGVPSLVGQVVARALSKDPAQRYPSVSAFARALRLAAAGEGADNCATVPGTFPSPGVAAAGIGAMTAGATLSQAATRPAREAVATKVLGDATEQGPRRSTPIPSTRWLAAVGRDDAQAAQPPAERREKRRRTAAIAILAGLLTIALVGMFALGPFGARQRDPSRAQSNARATSTASRQANVPPIVITPSATPAPGRSMQAAAPPSTPTAVQPPVSPDKSALIALDVPQTVTAGQRFNVSFTIANTGTSTWSEATGYRLVCDTLNHSSNYCPQGLSVSLQNYTIAPGQRAQFVLTLLAPSRPGAYATWVNLARNGVLFGTPDVTTRFAVQAAPPAPPATATSAPHPPSPTPAPPTPTATSVPPAATATPAPPGPTATPAPPAPTVTVGQAATKAQGGKHRKHD